MRRLIIVLMAGLLFLSACGDSDSPGDAAPTGEGDSSETADSSSGDDSTSTTAAPSTTEASTTTVVEVSSGSGNSNWCQESRDIAARSDEIEALDIGFGEQFRIMFEEILPRMKVASLNAPGDLDVDFDYFFAKFDEFEELLMGVDFQILSLSEEQLTVLDDELMNQYDDAIDDYNENVCGISGDVENADDIGSGILNDADIEALLTGPRRAETLESLTVLGIDEDVAECAMRELLSEGVTLDFSSEYVQSLTDCGLTVADLAMIGISGGDASTEGFDEIAGFLDGIAGNPGAAQAILPLLTGFGLEQDAAQCLVDAIGAADSAGTFSAGDAFTDLLDGCDVDLTDLTLLLG